MATPARRSTATSYDLHGDDLPPPKNKQPPKLGRTNSLASLNTAFANLALPLSASANGPKLSGKPTSRHHSRSHIGAETSSKEAVDPPRLSVSDTSLDNKIGEPIKIQRDKPLDLFEELAKQEFAVPNLQTVILNTPQQRACLESKLTQFFKTLEDNGPLPGNQELDSKCLEAMNRDAAKQKRIEEILKLIDKAKCHIRDKKLLEQIEGENPEVRDLLITTNESVITTKQLFKAIKSVHKTSGVDAKKTEKHIEFCERWLERNAATALVSQAAKPIKSLIALLKKHTNVVIGFQNLQLEKTLKMVLEQKVQSVAIPELSQIQNIDFLKLIEEVCQLGLKGDCSRQVEMLAGDLFLFQNTLFSLFNADDLVANKWPKSGAALAKSSPLMNHYCNFADKLCFFVISQVLNKKDEKDRAALIRFFAKVAVSSKSKGDLVSMVSLHNAIISHTAISRLANTWKHLEKGSIFKSKKMLTALCEPREKFAALKAYSGELSEKKAYHIPFFAGCLGEITAIEEKISPVLPNKESYNIDKMRVLIAKISTVLEPQKWPHGFAVPKGLTTNLIQHHLRNFQPNEPALYNASKEIEP